MKVENAIKLTYNWNEDRKQLGAYVMKGTRNPFEGGEILLDMKGGSIYGKALKKQVKEDLLNLAHGDYAAYMKRECAGCQLQSKCPKYQEKSPLLVCLNYDTKNSFKPQTWFTDALEDFFEYCNKTHNEGGNCNEENN